MERAPESGTRKTLTAAACLRVGLWKEQDEHWVRLRFTFCPGLVAPKKLSISLVFTLLSDLPHLSYVLPVQESEGQTNLFWSYSRVQLRRRILD